MGLYLIDSILTGVSENKYQVYDMVVDPLAVQCSMRRNGTYDSKSYPGLSAYANTTLDKVTVEDIELADDIRNYYSKKLLVHTLAGHKLSKYRSDLSQFLVQSKSKLDERYFGIISTLYDFYIYDTTLDRIWSEHITGGINNFTPEVRGEYRFMPVGLLKRKTRVARYNMYWFKMVDSGMAAVIPVRTDNGSGPLVEMWDSLYHSSSEIGLEGDWKCVTLSGKTYLQSKKWKITGKLILKEVL
jgi:hypothetical protein